MEWMSDIFDESVSKDSLHAFCGTYEDHPRNQTTPSTSVEDTGSDSDINEDVDRAIAISLSEEIQRIEIEKHSQLKEDELLARAIQHSLNFEGSSQAETEHDSPEFEDCHSDHEIEDSIPEEEIEEEEEIEDEEEEEIEDEVPTEETEINLPTNYPNFVPTPYYNNDTQCDVCKYYIPKNPYGYLEYRSHPFWLQKYCTSHEHDGTPRCCSCERMKSYDSIFVGLDDGRKLCLECHESAIMDTDSCQPLYLEIKKFYEGLGMKLEQHVPLLLVERQALNEAREGEKDGHRDMPETRGICLSEEQPIRLVPRRPKNKGGQSSDNVDTEPHKSRRHCEVTAIMILHGLPRLLTGIILTHELMHAWLRLQGYPTLRPEVEEGICQVMALMWLEMELQSQSMEDKKFGQFLKQSIVSDASPAYGDGFRLGWKAAAKLGLKRTLDNIRNKGNFQ